MERQRTEAMLTMGESECARQVQRRVSLRERSWPDAFLKGLGAFLRPVSKEVAKEKPCGCVRQCQHIDVDKGGRVAFADAEALHDERVTTDRLDCTRVAAAWSEAVS